MEVRIGVAHVSRELSARTDMPAEEVTEKLVKALADDGLFEMSDEKGRRIVVPATKVAYLDFGVADERPVGFGAL